ncbi:MAG: hypothetical protein M0P64_00490 [Candidatus Pacebacteria bacterium]|jgi:hypothetical protein|nr:hypothetical protein [Candidatus Paceibacterota bacterium]
MEKAKWITPGRVIFVALVAIGIWAYTYANDLWNTAVPHQTGLNAQYKQNQSYLAAYESGFFEMLGVANVKSDKLNKILLDSVKGRYDGNSSAKPGTGMLFSAIAEAYPDLKQLDIYDKVTDYIVAQRAGYNGLQVALLSRIQSFDTWRQSNLVQSLLIKYVLNIPNKDLIACAGPTDCKYGAEALERMRNIVLTEGTEKAYATSKMAPLVAPKD